MVEIKTNVETVEDKIMGKKKPVAKTVEKKDYFAADVIYECYKEKDNVSVFNGFQIYNMVDVAAKREIAKGNASVETADGLHIKRK